MDGLVVIVPLLLGNRFLEGFFFFLVLGEKVKWQLVYGSPTTVDPVLAVGAIYKSAALGRRATEEKKTKL